MDNTFEQFQVVSRPIRKGDDYWVLECRLITSNIEDSIDPELYNAGDTTRFLSNAHPEEHEEGYVKYQSNTERHRGYIMTHRVDDSYSALYKAHEDVFISIGKGDGNGIKKEAIYKMNKVEKNLLENFLYVRNNALLFAKSNIDKDGKPTISDPDTGRPIYISDGIIPQVERFASKYVYNTLTVDAFQTALQMMNQKAEKETGNSYVMIVNEKLWGDIQKVLGSWLANFKTDGAYLYSKTANNGHGGYVSVGTAFNGYNFGGNSLAFKVDRTFSREYGMDKGFGLILDLTSDKTSNEPAIQMFTLKGGDFITNKLPGVGGLDGLSSGLVASTVASSKLINWGYSGIAVFNPYRSFIMR